MADNNYTLGLSFTAFPTVGYGTTWTVPGSAEVHTFVPAYGLSAVRVQNLSVSGSNTTVKYAVSADRTLPTTLTWDGATGQTFNFKVSANNQSLHAATLSTTILVYASGYGILSAGVAGTVHTTTSESQSNTFLAAGDAAAPSPVTQLSATGWLSAGITLLDTSDRAIQLWWTNPADADVTAIKVRRLIGHPVTAVTDGTEIYTGLLTTYNDTGFSVSDFGLNVFYGVYAIDNVAKTSSIVQLSAKSNFGGVFTSKAEQGRLYINGEI